VPVHCKARQARGERPPRFVRGIAERTPRALNIQERVASESPRVRMMGRTHSAALLALALSGGRSSRSGRACRSPTRATLVSLLSPYVRQVDALVLCLFELARQGV